jgi:hypothetical protein
LTVFPLAGLLFFRPLAGRAFEEMFRQFGSLGKLPGLTALCLTWWFPVALGLPAAGALVRGLVPGVPVPQRRTWIVGAFLMACAGLGICTYGVYQPVFALAGSIKTDAR